MDISNFIQGLPKAELHLHIEGTFEPELMFRLAERNGISIPYRSVEELRAAYQFRNLQEFLDIYYQGANVLQIAEDFYDLTMAYLERIHRDNVIHTEIFFDPQTHTHRGIDFNTVLDGIHSAMKEGQRKFGISYEIIMSFLRHLPEEDAFRTLEQALPHKDKITGVGLDSSELGNPPSKFQKVFREAAKHGFRLTAHAGEEGPAAYVREALDLLNVERIDHGNRSLDDEDLVKRIVEEKLVLTVCPLSNNKLQVCRHMERHPLRRMLDLGIRATVNSDDPAYFGGYMNDNFMAVAEHLDLSPEDLMQLSRNAFEGSFATPERKAEMLAELERFAGETVRK